MDNKSVFARNLKRYMSLNNKTRKDICDALGISYYTVSDWVNGKKYPRMDKVELLANYFGIQKSDLIEDKDRDQTAEEKETPTGDGGLPENVRMLVEFAKSVPEDKAEMILRVIRSIVEAD